MPAAASSSRESPSVMLSVAVMSDGLVMLSIWTPSSSYAATAAYVLPPDVERGDAVCAVQLEGCGVIDDAVGSGQAQRHGLRKRVSWQQPRKCGITRQEPRIRNGNPAVPGGRAGPASRLRGQEPGRHVTSASAAIARTLPSLLSPGRPGVPRRRSPPRGARPGARPVSHL